MSRKRLEAGRRGVLQKEEQSGAPQKEKLPFHLCSSHPKTWQSVFEKKLMKIMEHEMTFHQLISLKEA